MENPVTLITQPCPAIVDYILKHNHGLVPYLSPVHSPMLCTAILMKRYEGIHDEIAALSPCIAKTYEFDATHFVKYNVTLKKLYEYIKSNNITLPKQESGFDHTESSMGCLYSMPGGLKENVEFYLGKQLRIDQAEGTDVVYNALKQFVKQQGRDLPAIFDVLNCPEGCNIGTGCTHERNRFEVSAIMDNNRKKQIKGYDRAECERLYKKYDDMLRLDDFIRNYTPKHIQKYIVTDAQIESAFVALPMRRGTSTAWRADPTPVTIWHGKSH
jgi:iron only hydrogenase large subunit-like protein